MWAIFFWLLLSPFASAAQSPANEAAVKLAYQTGEKALRDGNLSLAQQCFLSVLHLAPDDLGARINLGVVFMRKKDWDKALQYLQDAAARAPQISGIRLNAGLAEYQKGDYAAAIPAFESVLHDQPGSNQARHLLGLCYLFQERYADAATALEPLWPISNNDLSYLYSLAVAAGNAQQLDWEERSLARLMELGKDSPLLHLLQGKAYLAHEDFEHALQEFKTAAQADPKLPLLHYNLGVVYRRQGRLQQAQEEFLRDIGIEPGVAFNFDQLGTIFYSLQDYQKAESAFLKALQIDPKLGTSWFGLTKVYKQEKRYPEALDAIQHAESIDAGSASVHYLRAQILSQIGRIQEAGTEMETVRRLKRESMDKLEQQVNGPAYHDPEFTGQSSE